MISSRYATAQPSPIDATVNPSVVASNSMRRSNHIPTLRPVELGGSRSTRVFSSAPADFASRPATSLAIPLNVFLRTNFMSEVEDLELITRVVDEAQNLLKGHLELDSADAPTTIANLDAL